MSETAPAQLPDTYSRVALLPILSSVLKFAVPSWLDWDVLQRGITVRFCYAPIVHCREYENVVQTIRQRACANLSLLLTTLRLRRTPLISLSKVLHSAFETVCGERPLPKPYLQIIVYPLVLP